MLVVLSHYPDLFKGFVQSLDMAEPNLKYKLLVRDGEQIDEIPYGWENIDGQTPFNYSRNVNLAWQKTDPYDVLLIGDDVRFNGPFFDEIKRIAYSDETVGVACAQLYGQSPYVCGYFKRSVIDAVGKMDEQFNGYGREDTDWCRRMELLGYRTQPVEIPVTHMGGGTSFYRRAAEGGESVQAASERANVLFEDKWRD